MGVTGLDAANYLTRATSTLWDGSFPLFINLWQWRPQNTGQGDGLGIGVAAGDQEFRFRVNNSNTIVQDVDGGLVRTAGAGLQAPDQTWFAQQGQSFGGSDFRQVWLNAANNDSDASAVGDISPDELRIGRSLFGSPFDLNWAIAEGSAWDSTGFSQTDLNNLAALLTNGGSGGNGANPLDVNEQVGQPWTGRLIAYWRLEDNTDINDLSTNGHDLSIVGTIGTFASHPPVDPVSAPIAQETVIPVEALETIVKVAGIQTAEPAPSSFTFDQTVRDWHYALLIKDQPMTFRHLSNMTSGYGVEGDAGEEWAYNDYGIALFGHTAARIFGGTVTGSGPGQGPSEGSTATNGAADTLFSPLQFEDSPAFFLSRRGAGISISPRDLARLGWLIANAGDWDGTQVIPSAFFAPQAQIGASGSDFGHVQVSTSVPRTAGETYGDYLDLGTFGGGFDQRAYGPGVYGMGLFLNGTDAQTSLTNWPGCPSDTMVASGHEHIEDVIMIPSLGIVIAFMDPTAQGGNGLAGAGNDDQSEFNTAVGDIVASVSGPGPTPAFPGASWTTITDAQAELGTTALDDFITAVNNATNARGVITRNGFIVRQWGTQTNLDIASAAKPLLVLTLAGAASEAQPDPHYGLVPIIIDIQEAQDQLSDPPPLILSVPTGATVPADTDVFLDCAWRQNLNAATIMDDGGNIYEEQFAVGLFAVGGDGSNSMRFRSRLTTPLVAGDQISIDAPSFATPNNHRTAIAYYVEGLIDQLPIDEAQAEVASGVQPDSGSVSTPARPTLILGHLATAGDDINDSTEDSTFTTVGIRESPVDPVPAPRGIRCAFRIVDQSSNVNYAPTIQTSLDTRFAYVGVYDAVPQVVGGTPIEALISLRRDRAVPIESEGAAVISQTIVTPNESLIVISRTGVTILESLDSILRSDGIPIESGTSVFNVKTIPDESLRGIERVTIVPLEVESAAIAQQKTVPIESLLDARRIVDTPLESLVFDRLIRQIPFEFTALVRNERSVPYELTSPFIAIIQSTTVSIEAVQSVRRDRLVSLEAIKNVSLERVIPIESLTPLSQARSVFYETFGGIVQAVVIPLEAEGQILVPPLFIVLLDTDPPLTARLITTAPALSILLEILT